MVQAWNTKGVEGVHRFLARAFRLATGELSDAQPDREQLRLLHTTIKRVSLHSREQGPLLLERILVDCDACNIENHDSSLQSQVSIVNTQRPQRFQSLEHHRHRVLLFPR